MSELLNATCAASVIVRTGVNVPWRWGIAPDGNYLAVCDSLKITVQAPTWNELQANISKTLNALLKGLSECHRFDEFMREQGWTLVTPLPARPNDLQFEVLFSFRRSLRPGRIARRRVPANAAGPFLVEP
jgi:hypothetical protein